jgi:hypothetical protein
MEVVHMNKKNQGLVFLICLFVLSLFLISCGKRRISISNGYNLIENSSEKIFLQNSSNENIFNFPVSGFVVNTKCIYGWLDSADENLFFVDTVNHKKIVFGTWNELDAHLVGIGLPKLTMKESYTFLDITTGHKKKTW